MPDTSTPINACDVVVHLANHAGTLIDISGSSNRAEMQFSKDISEYSVFGLAWKKRMSCKKDATLNLTAVYSSATDEAWDLIKEWFFTYPEESRRVRIFVPDESVGADDFDGDWQISTMGVPIDSSQAGPIMVALTLLTDGGVTLGTVAT